MKRLLLTLGLASACLTSAVAQQSAKPEDLLLKSLPWRNIGPAIMGGRIDDFAVVESNPSIIYLATAAGGLFKTINNGTTWEAIFDSQSILSIGDVTVAPSDPNIVWVGTGEANNRQSSSWGAGVFKSTDAGKTWNFMGLPESRHIGRIVIDPKNPNVVAVAAGGDLWGPSKERGIYRTEDGGKTWTQSLFINEDTGCTDLAIDLQNPDTMYAAMYQRRRTAFGFNGGGTGSGIYKSVDNGKTWKRLDKGLPTGDIGRIGLDIYRKNPNIVYCSLEHGTEGGIYRSDDKGESWKKMGTVSQATSGYRPMYFSQIRVDPNDDQKLFLGGVAMGFSIDGGKTFRSNPRSEIHADVHAIWIDPANSNHMMVGCDGGIQWSYDGAKTWDYVNTLVVSQFYEVTFDFQKPYWVYGGLQDNGSWGAPSRTLTDRGVSNDEWINVGGGDGFYCAADPKDPNVVYSESQQGAMGRNNRATGERKSIRPRPLPGEPAYRFDWNTPILISPHNHNRIYVAAERLFISDDRGDNWRRTEDLSGKPDRTKFPIMGVIPTPKTLSLNDGQDTFGQIVTISESPMKAGILYVGTDDGQLQVSKDDGKTWENVADKIGAPKGTYVTRVLASSHALGRVYATLDGHRSDDFKPYVFVSEDFGETWKSIASNLETHYTAKAIREHPATPNLLFVGTERGAFVSMNAGGAWSKLSTPLPSVPVNDIQIHPRDNDLILATHGRGIWILDDITPLVAMADAKTTESFTLFPPRPAVEFRFSSPKANAGSRIYLAGNPPTGAIIQYFLKEKPEEKLDVKLSVWSKDGSRILSDILRFTLNPGLNRVSWDMRFSPPAPSTDDEPLLRELTPEEMQEEEEKGGEENAEAEAANKLEMKDELGFNQTLERIFHSSALCLTSEYRRAGDAEEQTPPPVAQTPAATAAPERPAPRRRAGFGFLRGPRLMPGTYQVHFSVGKEEQIQRIELSDDPHVKLTDRQRKQRYDLEVRLLNAASASNEARNTLSTLKIELTSRTKAEGFAKVPKNLQEDVKKTLEKVIQMQEVLREGKFARRVVEIKPVPVKPQEDKPAPVSAPPVSPAWRTSTLLAPGYSRISNALFSIDSISEAPSQAQQRDADSILRDLRPVLDNINVVLRSVSSLSDKLKANKLKPLTPTQEIMR